MFTPSKSFKRNKYVYSSFDTIHINEQNSNVRVTVPDDAPSIRKIVERAGRGIMTITPPTAAMFGEQLPPDMDKFDVMNQAYDLENKAREFQERQKAAKEQETAAKLQELDSLKAETKP